MEIIINCCYRYTIGSFKKSFCTNLAVSFENESRLFSEPTVRAYVDGGNSREFDALKSFQQFTCCVRMRERPENFQRARTFRCTLCHDRSTTAPSTRGWSRRYRRAGSITWNPPDFAGIGCCIIINPKKLVDYIPAKLDCLLNIRLL